MELIYILPLGNKNTKIQLPKPLDHITFLMRYQSQGTILRYFSIKTPISSRCSSKIVQRAIKALLRDRIHFQWQNRMMDKSKTPVILCYTPSSEAFRIYQPETPIDMIWEKELQEQTTAFPWCSVLKLGKKFPDFLVYKHTSQVKTLFTGLCPELIKKNLAK
jgi:hypothetical protein